jgi:hypothetical protein
MISRSPCSISWNCWHPSLPSSSSCSHSVPVSLPPPPLCRIYSCLDAITSILNDSTATQGVGKILHHPVSENTPGTENSTSRCDTQSPVDFHNMSSLIAQSAATRGHESEFHGLALGLLKLYRIESSPKAILKYVPSPLPPCLPSPSSSSSLPSSEDRNILPQLLPLTS